MSSQLRLSIFLSQKELQALAKLSESQKRPVRDQASYLIVTQLIQEGLLPEPTLTPPIQNTQQGDQQP